MHILLSERLKDEELDSYKLFVHIYSIMELEEYTLRLEVCENCYQHEQIDKHSEAPFLEAFQKRNPQIT